MYSSYILKNDEGLTSYYTQNNILYKRIYQKNRWSNSQVIQTGVKPFFSLNTLDKDNVVMIFTHSIKNQIYFTYCKNNDDYVSKPILESYNLSNNPYFFCMYEKDIFTVIYAYKTDKNKYNIAKMQLEEGVWTDSEVIDTSYSINGLPFMTQKIADNHYVIFYETYQNSLNMCYREFSTNQISQPVVYHSTFYNLIDKSFLVSNSGIYTALIVKSMFSYQLLFRHKTKYGYKNVKVIAEGQKIHNVSIFCYDGHIYVTYTSGDEIYYVYGEEGEEIDFCRPQKLSTRLPRSCNAKKACVVCKERKHNQIIVTENTPFQPIIVTDINPFFQDHPFRAVEYKKEETEVKEKNGVIEESTAIKQEILESREKVNLINQINKLKTELYMKNSEIQRLENDIEHYRQSDYTIDSNNVEYEEDVEDEAFENELSYIEENEN
ncbi:MAG: hypothetical protein ACK5LY_03410 [Lachnospirales bacterium]